VDSFFRDRKHWTKICILTVVRMGKNRSDRAFRECCGETWRAKPMAVERERIVRAMFGRLRPARLGLVL
jgi:hypothetical protein